MNDIFHVFQNQNFIDLCMYQFGYAQNDPLSSFGPHIRSHYLFHYVISGKGRLQQPMQTGWITPMRSGADRAF